MWFTPVVLPLAFPAGFRPSDTRYARISRGLVKAFSVVSGSNFCHFPLEGRNIQDSYEASYNDLIK